MKGVDPGWIIALVTLLSAIAALLGWAIRWSWKMSRRVGRFLDDFFGEPAHEGLPPRPGVMTRLATLELSVAGIAMEVHPNSGHSLRDDIAHTRSEVTQVKTDLQLLATRVETLHNVRP